MHGSAHNSSAQVCWWHVEYMWELVWGDEGGGDMDRDMKDEKRKTST
jgi:hypothetical protein